MKKIHVAIFEDNQARRDSLQLLLETDGRFALAGIFSDGNHAVYHVEQTKPDVILMDIQMPGTDGIEAVKAIKRQFPETKIIMQTVFEDDEKVFAALRAGADGYILKKADPQKIKEAILDVYEGGSPITPGIAAKVIRFFNQFPKDQITSPADFDLTDREKQILRLLSNGLAYKMIADECGISLFTVKAHIRKIYEKMQVHSATEAIAKAGRSGLA